MARPRTGSAFVHGDHWDTRITLSDGSRGVPVCHHDLRWTGSDQKKRDACPNYEKARLRAASRTAKAAEIGATRRPTDRTKVRTIADLVARWVPYLDLTDLAPATRKGYKSTAQGTILDTFGKLPIESVGRARLRAWIRSLIEEGRSPSNVNNLFNTFSRMFNDADAEEWTTDVANPCRLPAARALLPSVEYDADDEGKAHLGASDIRAQIAATPDAWRRVLYVVAYTSGMRAGELFGLKWSDACAEGGVPLLRIRRALALHGDAGPATHRVPKTDASKRDQPLHPVAVAALKWWRDVGWREWVGRDAKAGDPIWPTAKGKTWRPRMADLFRSDLEAAGLPAVYQPKEGEPEPFEFRSTRRSFATLLVVAGISGDVASRLMGHAPESVRAKYYATMPLGILSEAVARIDLDVADMFGQAPRALPTGGVSSEPIVGTDPSETIEATKDESKQESALVAQWIEQRFPKSNPALTSQESAGKQTPDADPKARKKAHTGSGDVTPTEPTAPVAQGDALEALLALAVSRGDLDTARRALALLEDRRRDAAGVVSLDAKRRGAK